MAKRLSSAWSTRISLRGRDARDLAAQLRADRAAGAGDEHDLAGQVRADPVDLHHDRLAAEDVLDLHVADLADEVAAGVGPARARVAQELEDGRRVRTGSPRSRAARATRARSAPVADGIAMSTSSGSVSSRTRPRSASVSPGP
jgi:hypothetical protein